LAQAGYLPITYDNLSTGHASAVQWGPLIKGDINDEDKLSETFLSFKPKAVLHFASSALVIESFHNPANYYRNNVAATLTLLEIMREHRVHNLLFSSTCATYGHAQFIPITEEHPQLPISPYGRTKWMVEQMMSDFSKAYGLKTVFLRYFNAAGADLETQIGENHFPETHLIPSIIQTALGLREELIVYGNDFPTRDGSAVRDYIHVQDLADAHVLALQYLLKEQTCIAFNLGTETGFSVFEIIDAIQTFCAKTLPVRIEKSRFGEPSTLTANNHKAHKILGWLPSRSKLPILIESAWKWHQLLMTLDYNRL
jgi:UDP-glucose-4-epimerase GalE